MNQSVRQRNLFAAEDFTAPYRAFTQANFTAYDYDSIRAAMVDYIRAAHPENFNDWIQSSEFVMLIELLAFLGHNLAFRIDMAGRENFLATAERRESVLRIADMLGYQPLRHRPASGLLKIERIRTAQTVHDVAGNSLKGEDVGFESSYENFILVFNKIASPTNRVGNPIDSEVVGGVRSDIYNLENVPSGGPPVFPFSAKVNGTGRPFEVHALTIDRRAGALREREPALDGSLSVVHRSDGQGTASPDTGFFLGFRQGSLEYRDASFESPVPNRVADFSLADVNETDVWVQELSASGGIARTWTKVDSSFGASAAFNRAGNLLRAIYSVRTLDSDNVGFLFGDGILSDAPKGNFRFWTRSGLNETYSLDPGDAGTVTVSFDYRGDDGNVHRASMDARLMETVANASARESAQSVQRSAGRAFASQDRMVTGADYSVMPFTASENVRKVKAANRTFTGHGRYLLDRDPTGEYQNVEMAAGDGYIYKDPVLHQSSALVSEEGGLGVEQVFEQFIDGIGMDPDVINLFYAEYAGRMEKAAAGTHFEWQHISKGYESSTGYVTKGGVKEPVGEKNTEFEVMNRIRVGSIVEFVGSPYSDGSIETGPLRILQGGEGYSAGSPNVEIRGTGTGARATARAEGGKVVAVNVTEGGSGYYGNVEVVIAGGDEGKNAVAVAVPQTAESMWARVVGVHENGLGSNDASGNPTGLTERGHGAISLNKAVPNNARIRRVFPAFKTRFSAEERENIVEEIRNGNEFGLKYDEKRAEWIVLGHGKLPSYSKASNDTATFSIPAEGSPEDNSWIVRAVRHGTDRWEILVRKVRFVFGSDSALRFFDRDSGQGASLGRVGRDRIVVGAVNSRPGHYRAIGRDIRFSARGQFTGSDGHADSRRMVVALADSDSDRLPDDPLGFSDLVGGENIVLHAVTEGGHEYEARTDDPNSPTETRRPDGRSGLVFTWKRIADGGVRVDPAIGNIVDVNVMTRTYDEAFRKWMADDRNPASKPAPPSAAALERQFEDLEGKRSVSDSVIYRSGRYRILFGDLAEPAMRGSFQVVKVTGAPLSDSEIKTRVLDAVTRFFDIDNWDFGEPFYFTELSAFVHREMQGIVSSIVLTPTHPDLEFGGLFQINPNGDELLIPDVSLDSVRIVDALTDDVLGS